VLDTYASTEFGAIAAECSEAQGLHVFEDLLLVEVVDEQNRPVPPSTAGAKLLVTNLYNRALPLIRYELTDLATVATGPCACGRPHLRLAAIQGRREEVLSLKARGGGRVSLHAVQLSSPLLQMAAVRQFQLSPRGDDLLVRVVLGEAAPAETPALVRQKVAAELDRAGALADVTVEVAAQIERAGTGAKEQLVAPAE
jgi:phenylacetate-coenzyme A ligase PaaK-like adenylate-forming protein